MDPGERVPSGRTGGSESAREPSSRPRSAVRAIALSILLVSSVTLAGCSALTGGDSKDWTAGGADVPSEIESKMDTPPSEIYSRVEEMVGEDIEEPTIVFTGQFAGEISERSTTSNFMEYMTGPVPEGARTNFTPNAFYDLQNNRIVVNEETIDTMDGETLEIEIAAQFAWAIHLQNEWFQFSAVDIREHPVRWGTLRAIVTEYANEYTNGSYHQASLLWDEENLTTHEWARFGARQQVAYQWVDGQIDSVDEIPGLYESGVPDTSEQLLHDTDEPPSDMGVEINTSPAWVGSTRITEARHGEIGIRELLRTRLDQSTADAAAEGWGYDQGEYVRATNNGSAGMIWALRWDSEADADEFESAMESYLDQRRSETDEFAYEYQRLDAETSVVLAGNETTLANIEMEIDNGTVIATVGGGGKL